MFVAATLPNLLFGPIAGTLVDRWDHREVLVVSDILRAAVVVLMPLAATASIWLVYPLVFVLTTISIFFRPARVAIVPRLVRDDELLTANSALWVGETIADVIGFPLAGLFVALVADAVSVAFWFDGATYLASALLLSTLIPRPVQTEAPTGATAGTSDGGFRGELVAGWRFLRNDRVLLANTLQALVAQLTIGVLIGQTAVYAEHVFGSQGFDWRAVYGFIEGSQGAGNLIGGFAIGLIGVRLAKGRMIIVGYTVLGLLTTVMALSGNLAFVLAIAFGIGIANMLFVIPSQTLFQERTPGEPHRPGCRVPVLARVRSDDAVDRARRRPGRGRRCHDGDRGVRPRDRGGRSGGLVRAGDPRGVTAYRVSCRPLAASDPTARIEPQER